MADLAILGHPTRGNEVIEILEMLGGNNKHNYCAYSDCLCFYIGKGANIIYYDWVNSCYEDEDIIVFTLEEFLEKFPHKVGDKVTLDKFLCEIKGMSWENDDIIYYVKGADFSKGVYSKDKDLQPYKEETMEKEISGAIVNRFICLEGYDFYDDKGNIIDTKEITMKKKQSQYPKTFIEVLNFWHPNRQLEDDYQRCYKKDLIEKFQDLLYARDAYWKIAGDWKPDITNDEGKFVIAYCCGNVYTTMTTNFNRVLVFPTEEMRDAFYENFKDLIEECKEIL